MIGNNSRNGSRRNSASYSYTAPNGSYIVTQPDISQYTAQQPMQQQLIHRGNSLNGHDLQQSPKNPAIRLFQWYIAPMHSRDSMRRLWYHGANAVLSIIICFIMLTLFTFCIAFLPLCGIGVIFLYIQCLLARHFALIDSTFSYYFFGSRIFPRFSIFIPKSHEQSMIGALKEYITDPHMLQVILYFTFIKLPASLILSGLTTVIFSGVVAVLLSPLVFWIDPQYFRDDLYCLFGSKESLADGTVACNGWAINSFGETFLAFLAFVPFLPLTLHLSNFSAKLLVRVTHNFLSINSPSSPNLDGIMTVTPHNSMHGNVSQFNSSGYSLNGNGNIAMTGSNGGYRRC